MTLMMVTSRRTPSLLTHGVLATALLAASSMPAAAAPIADGDQYAWSENGGWLNFKAGGGDVQVYPDHLEGFVWHENLGWIRLGTSTQGGTHSYFNTASDNYGINRNNASGALSGLAWSENAGWINFAPTYGGVTVNLASSAFSGYAWGENIGWIKFSGTAGDSSPYSVSLQEQSGACGAAAGVATLQPPVEQLCASGFPGAVTSTAGAHTWTCAGVAGGVDAQCSAPGGSSGGGSSNGSVTFEATAGGCLVDSVSVQAPPGGGPTGRTMPYGAVAFSLSGCTANSATVELTFSGSVTDWEYWKFIRGGWVPMTTEVTLAGNTATIVIADNGPYDANPNLHEIDDPSGPAQRAIPIPTLSTWGLLATAGLMALLGAWRPRRRRA